MIVGENPNGTARQVRFKYVDDPGYRVIYANLLFGGVNPHHELRFDLIEEQPPAPEEETCQFDESGNIIDRKVSRPDYVLRIRKVGVVLPMSEVPSIIEWLRGKWEEYARHVQEAGQAATRSTNEARE